MNMLIANRHQLNFSSLCMQKSKTNFLLFLYFPLYFLCSYFFVISYKTIYICCFFLLSFKMIVISKAECTFNFWSIEIFGNIPPKRFHPLKKKELNDMFEIAKYFSDACCPLLYLTEVLLSMANNEQKSNKDEFLKEYLYLVLNDYKSFQTSLQ